MATTSTTSRSKRKALTLEDRVKVVHRHMKGESAIAIAKSLCVGKTQVQNIIADKTNVLKRWENGENADSKFAKRRKCVYDDLDEQIWDWFCNARGRHVPITGKLIQEKALIVSLELGCDNFSASNGWLSKFLLRHNIKSCTLSGERAEVDQTAVDDWIKRLPALCAGYSAADIFNADETGLYYRAMPSKTMAVKGSDCAGTKGSKERITVLLAASVTGEKLKPLVIGKSDRPRCFQGCDMSSLGLDYFANKKAWMTGELFSQWANKLNNKMRILGRHILMFIDNCPAHPKLKLSNVKFIYLPPNTTSKLQPCDAGIIQTVKLNYRKLLLRHVLVEMEADPTAKGPELARKVSLLDAMFWIRRAWNTLKATTVTKCFKMCGFSDGKEVTEEAPTDGADDQTLHPGVQKLLDGITMEQFATMDEALPTNLEDEGQSPDVDVTDQLPGLDSLSDHEDEEEVPVINFQIAAKYAKALRMFAITHNSDIMVDNMASASEEIERLCLIQQTKKQQASILNFFPKV